MSTLPELVKSVAELTERQVIAARSLQGETMRAIDQERADRLFELRIALQEGIDIAPRSRGELRGAVVRLREAEDRLARVARTVLVSLAALRPTEAPTYARTGTLRG